MSYPVQTDQVKLGLERLITQWKDKPKIVGLLQSYLQSINELEETYFQLLTQRSISTAIGVQLDNLGLLVGESRSNRGDEEYRTAIKLRSAINASDGTEPKVVELLKILSGADTVFYEELYPAGIRITLEGPNTVVTNDLLEELKFILAATITAELSFVTYLDPPFVFENDDEGEGFADYGATSLFDLVTNNGDNILLASDPAAGGGGIQLQYNWQIEEAGSDYTVVSLLDSEGNWGGTDLQSSAGNVTYQHSHPTDSTYGLGISIQGFDYLISTPSGADSTALDITGKNIKWEIAFQPDGDLSSQDRVDLITEFNSVSGHYFRIIVASGSSETVTVEAYNNTTDSIDVVVSGPVVWKANTEISYVEVEIADDASVTFTVDGNNIPVASGSLTDGDDYSIGGDLYIGSTTFNTSDPVNFSGFSGWIYDVKYSSGSGAPAEPLPENSILAVKNENLVIDYDSLEGGYLAENVTVTI